MIDLQLDLASFQRRAQDLGGALDQLPFALSKALNTAAEATRERLAGETWPTHVTVRNKNFMKAALTTKGARATKGNLKVEIYDRLGRAHLTLHDKGGTKTARTMLAIPSSRVRRGSKGVIESQRPRNLKRAVRKGDLIFQAQGRGKKSKLQLMYKLRRSAQQPADVPFSSDFRRFMTMYIRQAFPIAMRLAMQTRR